MNNPPPVSVRIPMELKVSHDIVESEVQMDRKRILAIEIETGGHHGAYVLNFARIWQRFNIDAEITFLVSPHFFEVHADEVDLILGLDNDRISLRSLSSDEGNRIAAHPRLRYYHAWKAFCKHAREIDADHGLLMYFDYFQLPMLISKRSPCPLTAIYFRPTYHYKNLASYRPTFADHFRSFRKEWLIKRVLRLSSFRQIYNLDPMVTDYMRRHFRTDASIDFLPDNFAHFPFDEQDLRNLKDGLGIEQGRLAYSLVGVLDRRKGVRELLEAARLLPPADARRICLILAGAIPAHYEPEVARCLETLRTESEIQLVIRNEFLPGELLQQYFQISDVVLTTYQKHMGSSSALIRAALARRPVLSSDYGLMGEIVRQRKLGITVDTTKPAELVIGLQHFLNRNLANCFDHQSAAALVEENSEARLADRLRSIAESTY